MRFKFAAGLAVQVSINADSVGCLPLLKTVSQNLGFANFLLLKLLIALSLTTFRFVTYGKSSLYNEKGVKTQVKQVLLKCEF